MAKTQKQLDKLDEGTQLKQLKNYQDSELVALAKVLRDQGLSDSEINAQVKAERDANKIEYKDAKTTLKAPGVQELFTVTDANGVSSKGPAISTNNTYTDDVATGVTGIIDNAREFASTHGIQDVNQVGGDGTYTGVRLNDLVKFTLNQNEDGSYYQGSGQNRVGNSVYKTLSDANQNYGKSFSADDLGKIKQVGVDANGNPIFRKTIAGSDEVSSYGMYVKNPDGTYTNTGYSYTKRPEDDGNFFSKALSGFDDFVNDVIPGGWKTVAAVAGGAYLAPEILGATEGATGVGAGTTAGTTAGTVAGTTAAETGLTDYLGSTALGDATTGAVGKGLMGTGLNAGTLAGAAGGTGITMPSLSTLGTLGGTASMLPGTAGLTAEQLATATELGQVGTNAASGLGYLGGASALPAGTAGITGVTGASNVADVLRKVSDLYKGTKGLSMPSAQSNKGLQLAQLVRSNENPFFTPKDTTTLANPFAQNQPVYIGTQLIK